MLTTAQSPNDHRPPLPGERGEQTDRGVASGRPARNETRHVWGGKKKGSGAEKHGNDTGTHDRHRQDRPAEIGQAGGAGRAPTGAQRGLQTSTAVTRKNAPQEINQAINQSASDGRSANLLDVAFSLAGAPALNADADAKAIEEARAKTGAEQISTMQVLENGQVVLIRLEGITPVKALPYETARNSARADLLALSADIIPVTR